MDVNESLLSIILGAPKEAVEEEEFMLHLCLRKGCYIGKTDSRDLDTSGPSTKDVGSLEKSSKLALEIIHQALSTLEDEICIDREPIILVIDSDVQVNVSVFLLKISSCFSVYRSRLDSGVWSLLV